MPSCLSAQQRWKPLSCVLVVGGEAWKQRFFNSGKGLKERSLIQKEFIGRLRSLRLSPTIRGKKQGRLFMNSPFQFQCAESKKRLSFFRGHRSENSLFQASLQAEELAKVQTARSSQWASMSAFDSISFLTPGKLYASIVACNGMQLFLTDSYVS